MTIHSKHITIANLVFCYIPVVLFMAGWCRWEIAVPGCAALLWLFYRLYRSTQGTTSTTLHIDRSVVVCVSIASLLIAVLIGYGGVFAGFHDYEKHSAVVQDLSRYAWPVIYDDAADPGMLTYYVGSYLFPGLIGKIFSSRIIGELMLGVVGWIGMLLLFVNILQLVKAETRKQQVWALVIYLLFSGLLLPAQALMCGIHPDVQFGNSHWYTYLNLQFRTSMVCLRWVWEQYTIPVLCLAMLYRFRDKRALYAVWILPALICGTWSFIALVAYAIAYYAISCIRERKIYWDLLSWQNIICALIGLTMVAYFAGSLTADKPDEVAMQFITNGRYYLISYLPFCLFMFGIYAMLIWKEAKKDAFFYITIGLLCVIPMFRAGRFNDWCLCASMPAFFMLCMYCIRFLIHHASDAAVRIRWWVLAICIAASCIPYPFLELHPEYTGLPENTLSQYACRDCEDIPVDLRTNYYTYDYKESIFYKYFARRK